MSTTGNVPTPVGIHHQLAIPAHLRISRQFHNSRSHRRVTRPQRHAVPGAAPPTRPPVAFPATPTGRCRSADPRRARAPQSLPPRIISPLPQIHADRKHIFSSLFHLATGASTIAGPQRLVTAECLFHQVAPEPPPRRHPRTLHADTPAQTTGCPTPGVASSKNSAGIRAHARSLCAVCRSSIHRRRPTSS